MELEYSLGSKNRAESLIKYLSCRGFGFSKLWRSAKVMQFGNDIAWKQIRTTLDSLNGLVLFRNGALTVNAW